MKKNYLIALFMIFAVLLTACQNTQEPNKNSDKESGAKTEREGERAKDKEGEVPMNVKKENIRTIYLAGGCFWGVEGYFSRIKGVVATDAGYANGETDDTNYEKIASTKHAETVKIDYDMSIVSLEEILLHYFRVIDPTSVNKQGNDVGVQYRTGVYYTDEKDLETIEKVFKYEESIHGKLAVEKEPLKHFVLAEDYHQDYLEKNPNGYCHINLKSAEEPLFKEEYKKFTEEELKKNLDELSYSVLRENATERPGSSELNDEYRKGIYVDKITGEALFASKDKFDSGCGWPSFSKPITTDKINYLEDTSHGMNRVEVRSNGGDNHLGHVFNDGPEEMGGLRYCINGASLEFIPFEEMEARGYKDYMIFCE